MDKFRRRFLYTWLVLFGILCGFAIGYFTHKQVVQHNTKFPILMQAFSILQEHGLNTIPTAPVMEYGMLRGMIEAYGDEYTIFVEPAKHELESNTLQGSFGGIGVRLDRDLEGYIVLYPIADGPASRAGLQDGDRLLGVDELVILADTHMDTIEAALRGPTNERVKLMIASPPEYTTRTVSLKRAEIPLPSVTWHLYADDYRLGVIELNLIAASTPDEIVSAFEDLKERGAQVYALDLRDNFGGLLSAGIEIARLFLSEGDILQQRYRDQAIEAFHVQKPGVFDDLPMVVIINQHTASAAEIIAGSIKVHKRATLIGVPSYGKDTIQLVFDLDDHSSLHVTAAKWWVPGLEPPVGEGGVQPDIFVEQSTETGSPDLAILEAAKILLDTKRP